MNGFSRFGADKKMLFSVGQFGGDQLIPLVEVNGDDATDRGLL